MDKDFMLTYYDKMVRPIWTELMKTPRYQRAAGEHDKIEPLLSEQDEPRLCAWFSESGVMLSQRKQQQSPS